MLPKKEEVISMLYKLLEYVYYMHVSINSNILYSMYKY